MDRMRKAPAFAVAGGVLRDDRVHGRGEVEAPRHGSQFRATLHACDGSVMREWTSSGKVRSEETSDGYYFMDQASGRLIEVTGTLIIEKLD